MFDGLIFLQAMVKSLYIIILSLCYFMKVDAKSPAVSYARYSESSKFGWCSGVKCISTLVVGVRLTNIFGTGIKIRVEEKSRFVQSRGVVGLFE